MTYKFNPLRLRSLRVERQIPLGVAADQLGISRHTLRRYEDGSTDVSFLILLEMARIYRRRLEEFADVV